MSDAATSVIDADFRPRLKDASDGRPFDVTLTFVNRERMDSLYNQLMSGQLTYEKLLSALPVSEDRLNKAIEKSLKDRSDEPPHFRIQAFKERIRNIPIRDLVKNENSNQITFPDLLAAIARTIAELSRELGVKRMSEAEIIGEV